MPVEIYHTLRLLYLATMLGACAYALAFGGRDHRAVAVIHLATSIASWPVAALGGWVGWHHVQLGLLAVDLVALAGFGAVALRSTAFWPLWVAGFHLDAVMTHIAWTFAGHALPSGYSLLQGFWAYPVMAALVFGTYRHRHAVRHSRGEAHPGFQPERAEHPASGRSG